jgi:hypothetical protein
MLRGLENAVVNGAYGGVALGKSCRARGLDLGCGQGRCGKREMAREKGPKPAE